MHPDRSDLSLQIPKASARIITMTENFIKILLINLRTKSKSIPSRTKATMVKFLEVSTENHSGR